MKIQQLSLILFSLLLVGGCGGGSQLLKLGDSPLTIQVTSPDTQFDGSANVYINGQFIGTTDSQSAAMKISLKKGSYLIVVAAEGYTPWRSRITLLGTGYKQNVLARLLQPLPPEASIQNEGGELNLR